MVKKNLRLELKEYKRKLIFRKSGKKIDELMTLVLFKIPFFSNSDMSMASV